MIKDYYNNLHGEISPDSTQSLGGAHSGQISPAEPLETGAAAPPDLGDFFPRSDRRFPGLQQLDFFLGRILNTLFQQSYKLAKDKLRSCCSTILTTAGAIDSPHSRDSDDSSRQQGFNLVN